MPMVYKQWNLHIYIQKSFQGWPVAPHVKLEKNIFSVGISNALFSILRSHENILLTEQVVEIRYIALPSYKSFNGSQSSRTDFEK